MKYNKIQIDLKKFTKLNFKDSSTVKIEKQINNDSVNMEVNIECNTGMKTDKIIEITKMKTTWREVYKVKLSSKESFVPGDSVGLLCPNKDEYPQKMLKLLNLENETYKIERHGRNAFKFTGKLYDFFKYVFDFTSLPKKAFINKISNNNQYLEYLCSREGSSDYFRMIKNWNNLLDLVCMFDLTLTLEDVLFGFEILKPRYFSLINKIGDNHEILVGINSKVVQIEDKDGNKEDEIRYEHVSQYIRNPNGDLKILIRPSSLIRINTDKKHLLICTGTGIAPFLSFLKNKEEDQQSWIIYGFRNDNDDLYEGEYKNTVIDKVKSSDGVYVTDFIKSNIEKIREYTNEDCSVYVCGRMDMQRAVYNLFNVYINHMIEEKRLFFDNWQ